MTRRWFWPSFALPGAAWLILLFLVPTYAVVAVAFGTVDPIFSQPVPVWNPLRWQFGGMRTVLDGLEPGHAFWIVFVRTFAYVALSLAGSLLIGYPVAYFIARHAGRLRTLFLVAFIAPFWISYMMRMLAWINLLQPNGYVNRILGGLGLSNADAPIQWLNGKPLTVVLGLAYGYVPYMILPLFGVLDRIPSSTLEAARDLGAGQVTTFLRVTLPLSRQGILAGIVIVSLPMFGDYFTQTLLAGTRNTAMIGNLIVSSIQSSLVQTGASLVLILLVLLILPMLYYLRATSKATELVAR